MNLRGVLAKEWKTIVGTALASLLVILWPPAIPAIVRVIISVALVCGLAVLHQLQLSKAEQQADRRRLLERLQSHIAEFSHFVELSQGHARNLSVFQAAIMVAQANIPALGDWQAARYDLGRILFNWHLQLLDRIKIDLDERAWTDRRIAEHFDEVSLLLMHYDEAIEEFHRRCKQQNVVVSENARDHYKAFVEEYNVWVKQLRDLRDEAARKLTHTPTERMLKMASAL